MLFLNLLLLSILLNVYGIFKEQNKLLKFLHLSSFILFIAGFLFLITMGNLANESNNYFQLAFLFGAAILFVVSITKILNKWNFKNQIMASVSFVSSFIISYSIISNYVFFIDKERSGFINPIAFVNKTPCSNNVFIYFAKKGNDLYYRCPIESAPGLFIVIGNPLNFPLIPWPSFYEGKSKAIERALHTKDGNQVHIDASHILSIERQSK